MTSTANLVAQLCVLGLVITVSSCKPKASKTQKRAKTKEAKAVAQPWPAKLAEQFPDLTLRTLEGKEVKLSSYKGKMILFHLAGIQSPASTTIAGGQNWPPKKGKTGFPSLSHLLHSYGLENNKNFVVIHGLLLDDQYDPPTLARAKEWVSRFKVTRSNVVTLVGDKRHVKNDVALSHSGTLYFIGPDFKVLWESGLIGDQI